MYQEIQSLHEKNFAMENQKSKYQMNETKTEK